MQRQSLSAKLILSYLFIFYLKLSFASLEKGSETGQKGSIHPTIQPMFKPCCEPSLADGGEIHNGSQLTPSPGAAFQKAAIPRSSPVRTTPVTRPSPGPPTPTYRRPTRPPVYRRPTINLRVRKAQTTLTSKRFYVTAVLVVFFMVVFFALLAELFRHRLDVNPVADVIEGVYRNAQAAQLARPWFLRQRQRQNPVMAAFACLCFGLCFVSSCLLEIIRIRVNQLGFDINGRYSNPNFIQMDDLQYFKFLHKRKQYYAGALPWLAPSGCCCGMMAPGAIEDYLRVVANQHHLLCLYLADPQHPYSRLERQLNFLCTSFWSFFWSCVVAYIGQMSDIPNLGIILNYLVVAPFVLILKKALAKFGSMQCGKAQCYGRTASEMTLLVLFVTGISALFGTQLLFAELHLDTALSVLDNYMGMFYMNILVDAMLLFLPFVGGGIGFFVCLRKLTLGAIPLGLWEEQRQQHLHEIQMLALEAAAVPLPLAVTSDTMVTSDEILTKQEITFGTLDFNPSTLIPNGGAGEHFEVHAATVVESMTIGSKTAGGGMRGSKRVFCILPRDGVIILNQVRTGRWDDVYLITFLSITVDGTLYRCGDPAYGELVYEHKVGLEVQLLQIAGSYYLQGLRVRIVQQSDGPSGFSMDAAVSMVVYGTMDRNASDIITNGGAGEQLTVRAGIIVDYVIIGSESAGCSGASSELINGIIPEDGIITLHTVQSGYFYERFVISKLVFSINGDRYQCGDPYMDAPVLHDDRGVRVKVLQLAGSPYLTGIKFKFIDGPAPCNIPISPPLLGPLQPGIYRITTCGHVDGEQPAGWGLAAIHVNDAARNGGSTWVVVHEGDYWPCDWSIEPGIKSGTYRIKTCGHKEGEQSAGWGLSAWHSDSALRDELSSRVAVHTGNYWPCDWSIEPGTKPGTYRIKTCGHDDGAQRAGWSLSAWHSPHLGGRRNEESSWVYVHESEQWACDWTFECISLQEPIPPTAISSAATTLVSDAMSEKGDDLSYPHHLTSGMLVNVLNNEGEVRAEGIVRFVGSTDFTYGCLVGVEFTSPNAEGETNGTILGRAYFSCAPNKGAFLRPEQVQVPTGVAKESDVRGPDVPVGAQEASTAVPSLGKKVAWGNQVAPAPESIDDTPSSEQMQMQPQPFQSSESASGYQCVPQFEQQAQGQAQGQAQAPAVYRMNQVVPM